MTFEGRGVLSPSVDLLAEPDVPVVPAGAACVPSTEAAFECMQSQLQGDVIIHYNLKADAGATPPPNINRVNSSKYHPRAHLASHTCTVVGNRRSVFHDHLCPSCPERRCMVTLHACRRCTGDSAVRVHGVRAHLRVGMCVQTHPRRWRSRRPTPDGSRSRGRRRRA